MALMSLERFWGIIAASRSGFDPKRSDGNMDSQVTLLRNALSELSAADVSSFANTFTKLFHDAYRWDLWAAGYIIEGGCGDDGFTDFRYWLISMGRDVYDNAMTDVESLADVAFAPGVEVTRFEEFGQIPYDVLHCMNACEDGAGFINFEHPEHPDGTTESIDWDEIHRVEVVTTDEGPFLPDSFWVLTGDQVQCIIAQGAKGEKVLLERLQTLPEFDNDALISAMGSTSNERFLCWDRDQNRG